MEIKDLVQFDASGITVASFSDIRSAIIDVYKDAYGTDIDLSTSSADGVYVNNLALIMNNSLQAMLTLYSNLNVDNATGKYLDTLCALSNVTRKQATRSTASLLLTSSGASYSGIQRLTFLDKAGVAWIYSPTSPLSISSNETVEIQVTCEDEGAVEAPAGFISALVEQYSLTISQPNAAEIGREVETDDELRARRYDSLGLNGLTVVESIVGSLLTVSGIRDVYIYNNNTGSAVTAKDTSSIGAHSIYVVLRYEPSVTIANDTIGNIIHKKLTPGIGTSSPANGITTGTKHDYVFVEKTFNTSIADSNIHVYWKEATPVHPSIAVQITAYDYFTGDEANSLGSSLISYLNALPLSENLDKNKILLQAVSFDPKFKGNATYYVNSVTIASADLVNPDTYYNYTTYTVTSVGNVYTITLG